LGRSASNLALVHKAFVLKVEFVVCHSQKLFVRVVLSKFIQYSFKFGLIVGRNSTVDQIFRVNKTSSSFLVSSLIELSFHFLIKQMIGLGCTIIIGDNPLEVGVIPYGTFAEVSSEVTLNPLVRAHVEMSLE
jgi:hypothetical protein